MQRAAVIIGVNKSGNLPVLQAAVASAREVEQWAVQQKFSDVTVITDEAAPVTLQRIKDAVKAVVDKGTVDQLLVYFSGHGVNIRYGEYWLLTDAPLDSQAAVNVDGSVTLARQAGIPHVVMVSDACRTAADGTQAQGVTGEIFPNKPIIGPERAVDLFFATMLGAPALELLARPLTRNGWRRYAPRSRSSRSAARWARKSTVKQQRTSWSPPARERMHRNVSAG
jgi:hypothetical protein